MGECNDGGGNERAYENGEHWLHSRGTNPRGYGAHKNRNRYSRNATARAVKWPDTRQKKKQIKRQVNKSGKPTHIDTLISNSILFGAMRSPPSSYKVAM